MHYVQTLWLIGCRSFISASAASMLVTLGSNALAEPQHRALAPSVPAAPTIIAAASEPAKVAQAEPPATGTQWNTPDEASAPDAGNQGGSEPAGPPPTEPVPPPPPAPSRIDLQVPPEPPPPAPYVDQSLRHPGRVHDGFFLRVGLGLGLLSGTGKIRSEGVSQSLKLRGVGALVPVLLGGTPAPGLVIGGGILAFNFTEPTVKIGGQSYTVTDSALTIGMLGPFVHFYPDPTTGFYIHAMGAFGFDDRSGDHPEDPAGRTRSSSGWAVSGAIGYDFWVGREWSLGPEARVSYLRLSHTEDDTSQTRNLLVPTLSFTATFH